MTRSCLFGKLILVLGYKVKTTGYNIMWKKSELRIWKVI